MNASMPRASWSNARGLKLQIAKLEAAVSALQMVLNVEHSKTIDLPNVLRAVN